MSEAVDVRAMKFQCLTCGVPIDTVAVERIEPGGVYVNLAPCGHEASFGDLAPGAL